MGCPPVSVGKSLSPVEASVQPCITKPLRTLSLSCWCTSYVYPAGPYNGKPLRTQCDVHSFVNQLTNDHYSAVFVLYFRDTGTVDVTTHHESESSAGRYKMIMRVNRLSPTLASCVVSVGRCSDEHRISGGYD
jgi:hypothetical protein